MRAARTWAACRLLTRQQGFLLALFALFALLAWAPAASAADTYQWSGTLTVVHTSSDEDDSFRMEVTGPITPSPAGFAWYQPTTLAYSDTHLPGEGGWCVSTSNLVPPDPATEAVPLYVDWGRPRTDGLPPVPRLIPGKLESSFPRHSFQCLAYNGGELMRYESFLDGIYGLSDAFACTEPDYGISYDDIPFAIGLYLSPPLPGRQVLPDGTIRFTGTVTPVCTLESTGGPTQLSMTVDLTGTPTPDPSVIVASQGLEVVVHGTQYGSVVGAGGAIACGQGGVACATSVPGGTAVRLAALESEAGLHQLWLGCDDALGQSCLLTVHGPRVVHAWFGYDFVGQWEPPPDGLFDPARKAEIASNGADAAFDGAVGCGLTAALIGTASGSSVIVAGTAGAATRFNALVRQAFEETVGNCATGLAGTIFNGLLLKIDPPDPQWRQLALAERFPRAVVKPCRPRSARCAAVDRARRDLVDANARLLELQEALAVAANRYGNAVTAKDLPTQALHQATMRATSRLLADASARRNLRARLLVARLRALGVRSATLSKAAAAGALRARAGRPRGRPGHGRAPPAQAPDHARSRRSLDAPHRHAPEGEERRPAACARAAGGDDPDARCRGGAHARRRRAPAAGGPARHAACHATSPTGPRRSSPGPCSATPGRAPRCRCSPTWPRPVRGCQARPACSCAPLRSRSRRTTCAATRRVGPDARRRSGADRRGSERGRAGRRDARRAGARERDDDDLVVGRQAPQRDLDGLARRPVRRVEQAALDGDVERPRRRLERVEVDRRQAAAGEDLVLAGIEIARHEAHGLGRQVRRAERADQLRVALAAQQGDGHAGDVAARAVAGTFALA